MAGKSCWRGPCAALAVCFLCTTVEAQEVNEAEPQGAAEEGSPAVSIPGGDRKILDTISVTATRNPIKSFEYPGMVSVIGRDEIDTLQPSTPDDILKSVPNVEFTGGPRRTGEVPSIRGFDGADVIVLFDGARQNFGSAHDGRFFIDPSLIKRAEVLRGASSSLYGSGGTGGVIEFTTVDAGDFLDPGEKAGARLSGGYQTVNNESIGTFTAFAAPLEGVDLLGSITKRDSGSIELGDGTRLGNTDDDILSGLAKAGFGFAEHHRVEGSFVAFSNDAEEPNNGQSATADDSVEKDIRSHTIRTAYSYKNPADALFDVDFVAYYTKQEADELRLDDRGAGPAGELLKRDVETIGFRLDNRSRLSLTDNFSTTFTYGGEFYRDEQDGAAGDDDRDGVPDADSNFYGLYAQAEVTISEAFGVIPGDILIIPGLRFDGYESSSDLAGDNDEHKLSPRIGVSYLPTDWLLLFGSYAQAFRAPTFNELYLTGTHFTLGPTASNFFISNPDLKPQETETVEFGGGVTFDDLLSSNDQLQVKASHFRIWGDDFIDTVVTQPTPPACSFAIPGDCDGTTQNVNVSKAKLWGTEVEASYESDRFLSTFGFSTINGKDRDTGDKLGTLTPNQFNLNNAVKIPEIDSILGWRVQIASDFDKVNDPDDERDGYDVHDFYFAWAPSGGPLEGLRVDLGIDNAFDENYSRVFTGAAEAGRNFKALVSYALKW